MQTIKLHHETPVFNCLTLVFPIAIYDEKYEMWFGSAANRFVYSKWLGDEYKKKIANMTPFKALTWGSTDKGAKTIGAKKMNPKWDEIKAIAFKKALTLKFAQHLEARSVLLKLDPKKHKLVDPYERKDEPSLVEMLWEIRKSYIKSAKK